MTEPRLSVIIPTWNGAALLPDCLDALAAESADIHEIIAVDNGSTDGSAELIADRYAHVHLFRNAQNLGFAQACNTGMRAATGDVLVLLNQDTRVESGWAAALQTAFGRSDAGIIGCKILSAADRSLQHAGGHVHESLGIPFHYGKAAADPGAWAVPCEVEYVTGAAMAIRRRVVEQIGGLDERFFPAYYEDVDLCFRARAAGFRILYWPDAVVLHYESTSTPSQTRWFYFQRGRIRFILKHWPLARLVADFAAAEPGFQVIFRGDFGSTRPLRLAYLAARIEAPAIAAERWPAGGQELGQISDLLRRLHAQALAAEYEQLHPGQSLACLGASAMNPLSSAPATQAFDLPISVPPLAEHEFRSNIPVVGWLIAAFRRGWYAVGAKWALRHLMGQQQAINQVMAGQMMRLSQRATDIERTVADLDARQDSLIRSISQQMNELRGYLDDTERRAAAVNQFLLDRFVEAEEDAIFALLWPLRWDMVLNSTAAQKEAE